MDMEKTSRALAVVAIVFAAIAAACSCVSLFKSVEIHQKEISKTADRAVLDSTPLMFPAEKVRVIDGDTFVLTIRVWEDVTFTKRVRLLGVDTPELNPKEGTLEERVTEKTKAQEAMRFSEEKISGRPIFFVYSGKSDSFGRALGNVVWFEGGARHDICSELASAKLLK